MGSTDSARPRASQRLSSRSARAADLIGRRPGQTSLACNDSGNRCV